MFIWAVMDIEGCAVCSQGCVYHSGFHVPYILAYKPTIFGWILTIKLWGSTYVWVMPHSYTLTAIVSTAWTISRPLGYVCAWKCVRCMARPHINCCCSICIPVKSAIITWNHSSTHTVQANEAIIQSKLYTSGQLQRRLWRQHPSHRWWRWLYDDCAELMREQFAAVFGDDLDADFRYRVMRESLIFARFSAAGMGIGLYAGRLIHEYIW